MNRINLRQFAAMLLIGDVFSLLCLGGEVTVITAAGFTLAAAAEFLIMLPFALYYRNGGKAGILAELILLAAIIVWTFEIFRMLWKMSGAVYVPFENGGGILGKSAVTALIALVCWYSASCGIKALGRASMIAAALGALCISIVAVYALRYHDWESLIREGEGMSTGGEFIRGIRAGGGIAGGIVLLHLTGGSYVRNAAVYLFSKAAVTVVLILSAVLILGGIMPIADYSLLKAAQLSQPFPSQRIDALFLAAFSVYAVFTAAVQTAVAAHIVKDIAGKLK